MKKFASDGYQERFVVEAEQDLVESQPLEIAKIGYTELLRVMDADGYV